MRVLTACVLSRACLCTAASIVWQRLFCRFGCALGAMQGPSDHHAPPLDDISSSDDGCPSASSSNDDSLSASSPSDDSSSAFSSALPMGSLSGL